MQPIQKTTCHIQISYSCFEGGNELMIAPEKENCPPFAEELRKYDNAQVTTINIRSELFHNSSLKCLESLGNFIKANSVRNIYIDNQTPTGKAIHKIKEAISDKGIIATLKHSPLLEKIILNAHKVDIREAIALAEVLTVTHSLHTLKLRCGFLGDKGAVVLATALKSNRSLEILDLFGNDIGDAGASALADAMQQNTSLKKLKLRGNRFNIKGGTVLLSTLKQRNISLLEMDLWNTQGHAKQHHQLIQKAVNKLAVANQVLQPILPLCQKNEQPPQNYLQWIPIDMLPVIRNLVSKNLICPKS